MANGPEIYDKNVHAGYTVLANKLSELFPEKGEISRQKVHMWATRSARNGFPQPVDVLVPSGKIKRLFYTKDAITWYFGYKPRTRKKNRPTVDN